ncbi:MAG: hypothetical protein R2876_05165 [Eubacteriales bacterium]
MRIILSNRAKKFCWVLFSIFMLILILINVIGGLFNCKYISVIAAVGEVNTYEVRSQLLMDAIKNLGVCKPQEAADIWASGLKLKSAAIQYSVMGEKLKDEYASQLDESAQNWATGISSPWVDSYEIVNTKIPANDKYIFEISFSLATSAGPSGDYNAVLTVEKKGDYWYITKIEADEDLYPYTRFKV